MRSVITVLLIFITIYLTEGQLNKYSDDIKNMRFRRAPQQDIRQLIGVTYLGNLGPRPSAKKILDAVYEKNPDVPFNLREHVTVILPNKMGIGYIKAREFDLLYQGVVAVNCKY